MNENHMFSISVTSDELTFNVIHTESNIEKPMASFPLIRSKDHGILIPIKAFYFLEELTYDGWVETSLSELVHKGD